MGFRVPQLSLLVKFSLLSFICVAGLGLALVFLLKDDIRERALEDARLQAEHMAVGVAVDLLTSEELQAGLDARTLRALDEAIEGHRVAGEIVTPRSSTATVASRTRPSASRSATTAETTCGRRSGVRWSGSSRRRRAST